MRIPFLELLQQRALWLSTWTIHHANHIRQNDDGLKVGGHQASSASVATILSVLYGAVLRPQDRVAVKPHAAPVFHALQYLFGAQAVEKLKAFRAWKGAQSYPSRTKDTDDVDFSTGSVGLGVAQTLFASLIQDYVRAKGWGSDWPQGRMVALLGDAEMDEGNIFEALMEGWKHDVRNLWWIVDYNRQSLDQVVHEGLWERFEAIFRSFGWKVVILKYGAQLREAFAEPGGERLRDWIDRCPNTLYSALAFQGGAAWRKRLMAEVGDQGPLSSLLDRRSDSQLSELMTNLAGHDVASLLDAFEQAAETDTPTCFIAYTIKGFGLPLQGHKDNHAGLMTKSQVDELRAKLNIREGHEWDRFEGLSPGAQPEFERALASVPFRQRGARRLKAHAIAVPEELPFRSVPVTSTQAGFGLILNEVAALDHAVADRIVTMSPDVTVSTNLGAWVNRRGLFAKEKMVDLFRTEKIASTFHWEYSAKGQHLELGIAEMNLFLLLSAAGLSHSLFGERLLPIGTVYDPFIMRGLDALNHACYQDARFIIAGTPSGVSLAPEGGAHQSIATPLIGMAQDGLCAFEPAFVDELAVILRWSFEYLQRDGDGDPDETTWLRDQTGGSVYLRLSTRPLEQPKRSIGPQLAADILGGAYWLRPPGANPEVIVAYQGAVAAEAIAAVGLMAENRRDIGLLAVTSADRLQAGAQAAERARQRGNLRALSHIERLLAPLGRDCAIVSVIDGHPATLAWLGGIQGQRQKALGVEHFGQTGSIADLYRHHGLDTNAILNAAQAVSPGAALRHLRALA
jgi:pyruvate dehydrogenase E1 component